MSSSKSTSSKAAPPSSFTVEADAADTRLDKLLSVQPGIASRETARRLILQGVVTLNGAGGEPSTRLKVGDRICYTLPPPVQAALVAEHLPLDVIYEDAALIVVNKPCGMPMHPGPGHPQGTLVNYLLGHCGDLSGIGGVLRPGIVHRLDMDTSGVVVAAKHDAAHRHLSAQFKAHTIHRQYEALVVGKVPGRAGTIDLPLERQRSNRFKRAVTADGKRAVTHWRRLACWGPVTHLSLRLETGRTHQIRVHLSHQDWPVLGDPLYGLNRHRGLLLDKEVLDTLEAFGRQALHAVELGFIHPESGEQLAFSAPPPPDMQNIMIFLKAHFPAA